MTLKEFYKQGEEKLAKLYNSNESRAITKRIASYLLKYSDSDLLLSQNEALKSEQLQALEKSLEEVATGMPVQYVLGETTFYGYDVYVEPGVLIPRQETEELVDWIIQRESEINQILDIGVGSGCITIALGKHFKRAHCTALDISLDALDLARENCDRYSLRPTFLYADVLKWETYGLGKYDVIVSNPPYIRESENSQMHPNVLDYEPDTALFVTDEKPLLYYEAIADLATEHLNDNGALYFEINEALGKETIDLLDSKGYRNIELRKDINGKDRMIRATR
ncbi:release factor glutamine methyltransferase [Balneicella halophila]|uniref:Release factor glutamine methyltransferase n=1 Tax=Balneicella halophila TaxID=1537566 RepID=A0A7L4UQC6_BALHA|nr:peptide chain release factor N(5)-glutamine methyltransferase [Balneicella halophila]PVX51016.1 release factor glutamine methyltransferase [Balneicella halophila]